MATNSQIKKANTSDDYTPEMVMELRRCKVDPVYFITEYVKVQHPTKGTIPFALYEYQKRMVKDFQANQFTCVLTGRQQGKCITEQTRINTAEYPKNFFKQIILRILNPQLYRQLKGQSDAIEKRNDTNIGI